MTIIKTIHFLSVAAAIMFSSILISSCEAAQDLETKANEIKISMAFNGKVVTATLYDNATTRNLVSKLPLTLSMLDLYSREIVYRFPEPLPTDNVAVRGYEVGEIVYYPPAHSFVILYAQNGERFSMQRLGWIDSGIELFENAGPITVTIELLEDNS